MTNIKKLFEYNVSDERGWRLVRVFTEGDEMWAEAENRDAEEVMVSDNWWNKVDFSLLRTKLIIKEDSDLYNPRGRENGVI